MRDRERHRRRERESERERDSAKEREIKAVITRQSSHTDKQTERLKKKERDG